jgi:hypothetical protein
MTFFSSMEAAGLGGCMDCSAIKDVQAMEKTEMLVVLVELSRSYQNKVWDETTTRATRNVA